jgi:Fe-S-cluster containining protein
MAQAEWPRDARDSGPFRAELKCCTFEPFLPNFTLGRLLAEGSHGETLGKAFLRGRMTPLGLLPKQTAAPNFGRNHDSKCSFLTERGSCSIWQNRPSVCRSYFCVSDSGNEGQAAWKNAETLGNEAEWSLAHELLWDLGFTQDEIVNENWAEWRERKNELWIETAKRAFDPKPQGA